MTIGTVDLMGLRLARLRREQLEDVVFGPEGTRGGRIVTANLEILRQCTVSADATALVEGVDLIVADGAPLVWASRIARDPLPERVAGSDLIWTMSERAAREGRSVYLLGGRPGAAEIAAERLSSRSPGLRVTGFDCPSPGFERSARARTDVVERLVAANPDIVYVGLGFPKQEAEIVRLRRDHPAAWYVGVGVSIDFVAGFVPRAPRSMQRHGFEWVYRLYREPRKLFGRYVVRGLPFAARLLGWAATEGRRR